MITLFDHQQRGVLALRDHPRYALWWSMGTGKTMTVLSAIANLGGKTVVICPKSVMRSAWVRDAINFPALRVAVADGAKIKRLRTIGSVIDICVINPESFRVHAKDFTAAGYTRLVLDESSKAKNPKAQFTDAATRFADTCESVWLLSGTPAPNCPSEYVPQMRILSPEVFGRLYWPAINRYFVPVRRMLRDGRQIVERYNQTEPQSAAFKTKLQAWSWSLKKEDCLTLPAKTDQVIEVELSSAERAIYANAEKELVLIAKSGESSRIKQEAALIKLRQIVGGSVLINGMAEAVGRAKMDALHDVLDSVGPNEPVVIWAEFREEIRRITDAIVERGETVGRIDGETSHKSAETVADFQSGKIKRVVCHPASAGHGLTLTAASYAVYHSLSFSLEQHEQSRDRIHRVGQTRPCTYLYLIARDTVDEPMLKVLHRKRSVAEAMTDLLKRSDDGNGQSQRDDVRVCGLSV